MIRARNLNFQIGFISILLIGKSSLARNRLVRLGRQHATSLNR